MNLMNRRCFITGVITASVILVGVTRGNYLASVILFVFHQNGLMKLISYQNSRWQRFQFKVMFLYVRESVISGLRDNRVSTCRRSSALVIHIHLWLVALDISNVALCPMVR